MKNRFLLIAVILAAVVIVTAKGQRSPQKCATGCLPMVASPRIQAGKPAWVLIHSSLCIPCKQMEKTAAAVMPGWSDKVQFVDVLVDRPQDQKLMQKYKVSLIPTSVFLDKNGKEISRFVGVIKKDDLNKKFARMIGK